MLIGTINSVQYLNGSIQGIQGATGNGIASIVLNNDYTLTVNYTDGTSYTSGSIRGATGATGATPSFSIGNVITGSAGSDAEATITGTDTNPVLNLTLPRGETGNVSLEQLYALAIKQSISGEIASFSDGGDNLPMPKCEVTLDPIQDLNGYDAPWVGGAGKNKLPTNDAGTKTIQGVTFTVRSDGTVLVNGTNNGSGTASFYIHGASEFSLAEGNYVLSGCPSGGGASTYFLSFYYGASASNNWSKFDFGSGQTYTLTSSTNTGLGARIGVASGATVNNLVFYPMLRLASESDATYEPYENICPISGTDNVDTYVRGINIWNENGVRLGWYDSSTGAWISNTSAGQFGNIYPIQVVGGESYYIKTPSRLRILQYKADGTFISASNHNDEVLTMNGECAYINFNTFSGASSYPTYPTYNYDISINYPSTDHDYHAYNGTTYTTPLGRTVYGGTLDIVSGTLTVKWAAKDMGSLTYGWNSSTQNFWCTGLTDKKNGNFNIISSCFKTTTSQYVTGMVDGEIKGNASAVDFYIKWADYAGDTAGVKTALSGQTVCYELATPQTYQLTPQQIQTLLGTNNVWANSGDVEVVYIADTKLYVDNH